MPNEYETANHINGSVCLNGVVIFFAFLAQNSCIAHKIDHKTYTSSIIIHRAHCVSSSKSSWVFVCTLFVQFSTAQCFPLVKTEFIWYKDKLHFSPHRPHHRWHWHYNRNNNNNNKNNNNNGQDKDNQARPSLTHLHNTHEYQLTSFWISYFPKLFASLPIRITYEL